MTDTGRYKLLHAKDAQGEIGKVPPLPPGCVTLDWTERSLFEAAHAMAPRRTKR